MNVIAILTAAGSGKRFSLNNKERIPKQFINLLGKPVILYSLLALQKSSFINQIVITAEKKYFETIHSLVVKYRITKLTMLVEGGKTRFESVKNAFNQVQAYDNDLVLIHDAARPNIDTKLINSILSFAWKKGNTVIGTKIADTVKKVNRGIIKDTVNRDDLWAVQTPQVFKYKDLKKSYSENKSNNYTDESSLLESAGYKVNLFEGSDENLKITTIYDLKLLKKLMK